MKFSPAAKAAFLAVASLLAAPTAAFAGPSAAAAARGASLRMRPRAFLGRATSASASSAVAGARNYGASGGVSNLLAASNGNSIANIGLRRTGLIALPRSLRGGTASSLSSAATEEAVEAAPQEIFRGDYAPLRGRKNIYERVGRTTASGQGGLE